MKKKIEKAILVLCLMLVFGTMLTACGSKETGEAAAMTAQEKVDKALSMKQESVDDLVAIIGEPLSKDYASSCLGDGQDGTWIYDEFLIYTYKDDAGEVVQFAELKN